MRGGRERSGRVQCFHLAVGCDDVDNAEQRHERYADDPHEQLLP